MYKELFNARAQLLSRPLNLMFGGFLVVVVIVVCLGSLFFLTAQSFLPEKSVVKIVLKLGQSIMLHSPDDNWQGVMGILNPESRIPGLRGFLSTESRE